MTTPSRHVIVILIVLHLTTAIATTTTTSLFHSNTKPNNRHENLVLTSSTIQCTSLTTQTKCMRYSKFCVYYKNTCVPNPQIPPSHSPTPFVQPTVNCGKFLTSTKCFAYGKFCAWNGKTCISRSQPPVGTTSTTPTLSPIVSSNPTKRNTPSRPTTRTRTPTNAITSHPSLRPTAFPLTLKPTHIPTRTPSASPTTSPSVGPTLTNPSAQPSYARPSHHPTPPTQSPVHCNQPFTGGCSTEGRQTDCNKFSGCRWNSAAKKCVSICSIHSNETIVPTPLPTSQPQMLPCQQSSAGCTSITSPSTCKQWSGCVWHSKAKKCTVLSTCTSFSCGIGQLVFESTWAFLPGCIMGGQGPDACQRQMLDVFLALGLEMQCSIKPPSTTFLPSTYGHIPSSIWGTMATSMSTGGGTTTAPPNTGWSPWIPPPFPASTDIIVDATSGSDTSGLGTIYRPVQTMARALQLARTSSAAKRTIHLRQGVYRLQNTIMLKPADSGLSIVGENGAVLSGAIQLMPADMQWVLSDASRNIWMTTLPSKVMKRLDVLSELFVNGQPAIRARYPNLARGYLGHQDAYAKVSNLDSYFDLSVVPPPSKIVYKLLTNNGNFEFNSHRFGVGGTCQNMFADEASYFCDPHAEAYGMCYFQVPAGVTFGTAGMASLGTTLLNRLATGLAKGVFFHAMHPQQWGMWSFEVGMEDNTNSTNVAQERTTSNPSLYRIRFQRGGWQEARGDCGTGGGMWFIENSIELLDGPNEFYLDLANSQLFFKPNGTVDFTSPNTLFEITSLREIVRSVGADNIEIHNIQFEKTVPTHMDLHGVPSGGDWTVTRQGAIFVETASGIQITNNRFFYVGGNGVFISGKARNVIIAQNEFKVVGSTAIMIVGQPQYTSPTPWLSSILNYPQYVLVSGNVASETGLWVKQSSGVMLSICKNVIVENNVFYNGARAGITVNDGFGGGSVFHRNVVFNQVRETSDQGPFNVWDRQKWSDLPLPNVVSNNFLVGNNLGPKGIDFDDGTQYWSSTNNVIAFGLHKLKGSDLSVRYNLILYPTPFPGGCAMGNAICKNPGNMVFGNNTCVTSNAPYVYLGPGNELLALCSPKNMLTEYNTFYFASASSSFVGCDGKVWTLARWMATGQDHGSTASYVVPSDAALFAAARVKLGWF